MGSSLRDTVVMRDPVHGDIELSREEMRVIDTPQFQRLRGIKQLGTAYLVFPGAVHTRFEHSIGTLHLTDRLIDAVNRNAGRDPSACRLVTGDERRILRFAALLHDVTHIPFGHNIEDQTGLLERHDTGARFAAMLGQAELGETLAELGVAREVEQVLAGSSGAARDDAGHGGAGDGGAAHGGAGDGGAAHGDAAHGDATHGGAAHGGAAHGDATHGDAAHDDAAHGDAAAMPPFMRQMLSDTIDADLLDYLRRDAYFTGLELRYDTRVIGYFRVDNATGEMFVDCEKHDMLREDIVSELIRLLETRYHFSERVYYHHAKVAAGALLARMVELGLRSGALTAARLQQSTDQSLLDALATLDLGAADADQRMRRFAARFARRELPKRVLVLPAYLNRAVQDELLATYFTPGRPAARFAWEQAMEARVQEEFGRSIDVIMYCPARRMQLKEARTLVKMPGARERPVPMSEFAAEIPRLVDLQDSYLRLWKLYVFTSEVDHGVRRRLQELCLEHLPAGCANAYGIR